MVVVPVLVTVVVVMVPVLVTVVVVMVPVLVSVVVVMVPVLVTVVVVMVPVLVTVVVMVPVLVTVVVVMVPVLVTVVVVVVTSWALVRTRGIRSHGPGNSPDGPGLASTGTYFLQGDKRCVHDCYRMPCTRKSIPFPQHTYTKTNKLDT